MPDDSKAKPRLTGAEAGRAAARKKTKLPPAKKLPPQVPDDERPQTHKIVTDGVDG